jgi:hypothetical protein
MRVSIFDQFGALNSGPIFEAIQQGFVKTGAEVVRHDTSADVAVIWSNVWAGRMRPNQLIWQQFRDSNRPVVVAEVGMLKRGITWKIGLNGTTRNAAWAPAQDPARYKKFNMSLQPWRRSGSNIVIALQRHDSHQWPSNVSIDQWLAKTVSELKLYTDRPIVIRPHPRQTGVGGKNYPAHRPVKIAGTYDDFDFVEAIQNAWAVVNWNSGPGSIAAINGVPVFVDQSSLAAPVGNLSLVNIESPQRPDREQWFNELCHTEWFVDEIKEGEPFSYLLDKIKLG